MASRWAGGIDLAAHLDLQLLNARAEAARQPKAAHAAALITYVSHLYRQRVRSQGTKLCVHTAAVAAERLLALTAQLSIRRCRHSIASQELVRADVECVHRCAAQEEDNNERHAQQRLRHGTHRAVERAVPAMFARVKTGNKAQKNRRQHVSSCIGRPWSLRNRA